MSGTATKSSRTPSSQANMSGMRVYSELYPIETVSLRYFNVYGPRQRPDSMYAAVIPKFIAALRAGESPTVHGDGLQSRDFAFVADVVRANILAATAPGEACSGKAYNIAGGSEQSLMEMLGILNEVLGTSVQPTHTDPRAGDVRHSYADLSQAKADLGYEPSITFADGLARTVAWFADR